MVGKDVSPTPAVSTNQCWSSFLQRGAQPLPTFWCLAELYHLGWQSVLPARNNSLHLGQSAGMMLGFGKSSFGIFGPSKGQELNTSLGPSLSLVASHHQHEPANPTRECSESYFKNTLEIMNWKARRCDQNSRLWSNSDICFLADQWAWMPLPVSSCYIHSLASHTFSFISGDPKRWESGASGDEGRPQRTESGLAFPGDGPGSPFHSAWDSDTINCSRYTAVHVLCIACSPQAILQLLRIFKKDAKV